MKWSKNRILVMVLAMIEVIAATITVYFGIRWWLDPTNPKYGPVTFILPFVIGTIVVFIRRACNTESTETGEIVKRELGPINEKLAAMETLISDQTRLMVEIVGRGDEPYDIASVPSRVRRQLSFVDIKGHGLAAPPPGSTDSAKPDVRNLPSDQAILDAAAQAQEAGEWEEALRIYEETATAGPTDVTIIANLATLQTENGLFGDAVDIFEELDSENILPEISLYPYGTALFRMGAFKDASEVLERAWKVAPESHFVALQFATAAAAAGDHQKAKSVLSHVEARIGLTPNVALLTALIAEAEGDDRVAFASLQATKGEFTAIPDYWEQVALSAYKSGHIEEAIGALRRLRDFDGSHELIFALPGLLLIQGESRKAEDELKAADAVRELNSLELETWGEIYEMRGELGEALLKYRKASSVAPDSVTARIGEAQVLRKQEQYDAARSIYEKYLVREPMFAGTWADYGVCASRVGRHDEAIAACQTAIDLDPKSAKSHYNHACVLAQAGYLEDAHKAVLRAFALDASLRRLAKTDDDLDSIRYLMNRLSTFRARCSNVLSRWKPFRPLDLKFLAVVIVVIVLFTWWGFQPFRLGSLAFLIVFWLLCWRKARVVKERGLLFRERGNIEERDLTSEERHIASRDAAQDPSGVGGPSDGESEKGYQGNKWEQAYVAATNSFIAEGTAIWGRHNFMAVLNGLVIAFIGVVLSNGNNDQLVYGAVAFGVILCLLWLQMMSRRWAYYDMYEETCREIEKHNMQNGPQPFVIAERFRANVREEGRNIKWRHQILGQRTFSYWIIGLFVALYIFLAAWTHTGN